MPRGRGRYHGERQAGPVRLVPGQASGARLVLRRNAPPDSRQLLPRAPCPHAAQGRPRRHRAPHGGGFPHHAERTGRRLLPLPADLNRAPCAHHRGHLHRLALCPRLLPGSWDDRLHAEAGQGDNPFGSGLLANRRQGSVSNTWRVGHEVGSLFDCNSRKCSCVMVSPLDRLSCAKGSEELSDRRLPSTTQRLEPAPSSTWNWRDRGGRSESIFELRQGRIFTSEPRACGGNPRFQRTRTAPFEPWLATTRPRIRTPSFRSHTTRAPKAFPASSLLAI